MKQTVILDKMNCSEINSNVTRGNKKKCSKCKLKQNYIRMLKSKKKSNV